MRPGTNTPSASSFHPSNPRSDQQYALQKTPIRPVTAVDKFAVSQSMTSNVTEFRCLFTYDIVRKKKRWQDGHATFHSFNKRIMLYDESRQSVADTHWTGSADPQEDDTIKFDRKAIIVELGEIVSTGRTDLTPILNRSRPGGMGVQSPGGPTSTVMAPISISTNSRLSLESDPRAVLRPYKSAIYRHIPLSNVLGPQKGPYGRATVPTQSPFEIRSSEEPLVPATIPDKGRISRKERNYNPSTNLEPSLFVHSESPALPVQPYVYTSPQTAPQPSKRVKRQAENMPVLSMSGPGYRLRTPSPPVRTANTMSDITTPGHSAIVALEIPISIKKVPKKSIRLSSNTTKRMLSCQTEPARVNREASPELVGSSKLPPQPHASYLDDSSDMELDMLEHDILEMDEMMEVMTKTKDLVSRPQTKPKPILVKHIIHNGEPSTGNRRHDALPKEIVRVENEGRKRPRSPTPPPPPSSAQFGPWTPESLYLFSWRPSGVTDEMLSQGKV